MGQTERPLQVVPGEMQWDQLHHVSTVMWGEHVCVLRPVVVNQRQPLKSGYQKKQKTYLFVFYLYNLPICPIIICSLLLLYLIEFRTMINWASFTQLQLPK